MKKRSFGRSGWAAGLLMLAAIVIYNAPSAHAASNCGNGNLQAGEQCDEGQANGAPGSCCTDVCTFVTAGTTCRAAANAICDTAETCTGSSATCPADTFATSSTVCRTSAGACDPAENCTGTSGNCPADTLSASSTVCRGAAGVCDAVENCTGSTAACPADAKLSSVCRASAGVCDLGPETCDGTSNNCPADTLAPTSTVCRASGGVCDIAENCTGTSGACPADAKSSAQCRASGGVCDSAENCDGTNNGCPADTLAPTSTVCRGAAGVCDAVENCTGTSASCPSDAKLSSVCRASSGVCDQGPETCDGTSNNCPADHLVSAGTTCRGAVGVCDVAETCTGTSGACPADAKSTDECRGKAGVCDVADFCDGTNDDCPADAKSTDICRPAVNPACDVAESCDGTNDNCPADVLVGCADNDGVACTEATCLPSGECSIADTCVEICRGPGFWQTHSGYEKGVNIGQSVFDSGGPIEVCGQVIDLTANIGTLESMLEGLCIRVQGVAQRRLYRQLVTAAMNCAISEGGTCDQITQRFINVKFSECSALCAGDPVPDGPTLQECFSQLGCFNGGGRIIDGQCVTGTCSTDTETTCNGDDGCPEGQTCVRFEDSCASQPLCSEDLDAPAQICPKDGAASSPKTCRDARKNYCNIDGCY